MSNLSKIMTSYYVYSNWGTCNYGLGIVDRR